MYRACVFVFAMAVVCAALSMPPVTGGHCTELALLAVEGYCYGYTISAKNQISSTIRVEARIEHEHVGRGGMILSGPVYLEVDESWEVASHWGGAFQQGPCTISINVKVFEGDATEVGMNRDWDFHHMCSELVHQVVSSFQVEEAGQGKVRACWNTDRTQINYFHGWRLYREDLTRHQNLCVGDYPAVPEGLCVEDTSISETGSYTYRVAWVDPLGDDYTQFPEPTIWYDGILQIYIPLVVR